MPVELGRLVGRSVCFGLWPRSRMNPSRLQMQYIVVSGRPRWPPNDYLDHLRPETAFFMNILYIAFYVGLQCRCLRHYIQIEGGTSIFDSTSRAASLLERLFGDHAIVRRLVLLSEWCGWVILIIFIKDFQIVLVWFSVYPDAYTTRIDGHASQRMGYTWLMMVQNYVDSSKIAMNITIGWWDVCHDQRK